MVFFHAKRRFFGIASSAVTGLEIKLNTRHLKFSMYNEEIFNNFNHFKLVKCILIEYNESELNQIRMTDNI